MRIARVAPWLALVLALAGTAAARGGEELEEHAGRAAAVPVAERALAHFDAGRYAEAIVLFERAEALYHAPPHLWFLGQAHEKLGHLVAARQHYQRLSDEPIAADAPAVFQKAQTDARWALSKLAPRIPSVRVVVGGADPEQVKLTIDGRERQQWWKGGIVLDPGQHRLTASAVGLDSVSEQVTLQEGQHETVRLVIGSAGPDDGPAPPESTDGSVVPGIMALSMGGAALVVGAITGYLSLSKVDELEELCPTKSCRPEHEELGDEAMLLGNVSTVGFIVGGVGVVAGIVLLAWQPGGGGEPEGVAARWGLRVGPGDMVLEGTF